jgi:hypothetical protein
MRRIFSGRRVIALLAILLLLVLLEKRAYEVLRRSHQNPHSPTPTQTFSLTAATQKISLLSKVESSIQKAMEPAAKRSAEEKAKASEQFGAALEKVGIETQTEASH